MNVRISPKLEGASKRLHLRTFEGSHLDKDVHGVLRFIKFSGPSLSNTLLLLSNHMLLKDLLQISFMRACHHLEPHAMSYG